MPIRDCPLTKCAGNIYRPVLPLRVINPHSNQSIRTYGIVDTGADECALPAQIANLLGHNLQAGTVRQIQTGNGITIAYAHTTRFEIYHPATPSKLVYTTTDIPVDYLPNLQIILLGVRSFLNKFVLKIDYPNKVFSIKFP